LVHLLAAEDGDIPVDIATHEEGGGGDVGDSVERGEFVPEGVILPGAPSSVM